VPLQVVGPGGVGFLSSVAAVMSGEPFCYVLKSDGTVWAWGWNASGELGNGTFTDSHVPVQVTGLTSVVALGGRGYHALAIRSDGSVWTWGLNNSGELGDGTTTSSNVPLHVAGISAAVSLTGGYEHSVVLLANKTLVAWGNNANGQLGIGASGAPVMSPTAIPGMSNVVQVSAGWDHTLAVTGDGTVWAWGNNFDGEIGDGTTTDRPAPYNVPGLTGIKEVSGGDCHSAALKADGTVWTWGCNTWGQLGNGACTDQHTPVQVMVSPGVPLTGVTIVRARDYHNVAIKSDGTVWSWGWNVNGASAGTDNSPYAVQVKGV
jgi:alpha-tubulin suppressor-like RCC1 family protein